MGPSSPAKRWIAGREAVSRGESGTRKTFGVVRNPDVQTLQDSRDAFDLYGPYLQQSGVVLLRVLQDSARATPEGDLALRSAARKASAPFRIRWSLL